MGFTPRQIDQMSFGEIDAAVRGFNEAHAPETKPPSDDEFAAAVAAIDEAEG